MNGIEQFQYIGTPLTFISMIAEGGTRDSRPRKRERTGWEFKGWWPAGESMWRTTNDIGAYIACCSMVVFIRWSKIPFFLFLSKIPAIQSTKRHVYFPEFPNWMFIHSLKFHMSIQTFSFESKKEMTTIWKFSIETEWLVDTSGIIAISAESLTTSTSRMLQCLAERMPIAKESRA